MTPLNAALMDESPYVRGMVPRILPILIVHAQSSRTLTYKELALQIDEFRRVRHLDKPLDAIGTFTGAHGVPPLEAIVVKSGPRPLPGFGVDYLLGRFLKRKGVIRSSRELASNRAEYIKLVHDEVFSFPWHKFFHRSDLTNSRLASRQKQARHGRSMDPGVSGTHARPGGAFEGRHNPVVIALLNGLPPGWKLSSRAKSNCDLVVERNSKVRRIFEVKCGTKNQDFYSALGELIFHTEMNRPAKGIIVIPGNSTVPKEWSKIFRKQRIPFVKYFSKDEGFRFKSLEAALTMK